MRGAQARALIYRAMGASIGERVFFDRDVSVMDSDLLTVGNDVCVCTGAYLVGHELSHGMAFVQDAVSVGDGCRLGESTRIAPGVTVRSGVHVPSLTSTMPGEKW